MLWLSYECFSILCNVFLLKSAISSLNSCGYRNRCFLVALCMPPDSKETEFGSSDQKASPSAGKNTGVVLVPCSRMKCISTAIPGGVDISEVPGCHLFW